MSAHSNSSKEMVVFIYHQNIRFLSIKILKVFKGVNSRTVKEIFEFRDAMPCQLRKQKDFEIPSVHSVFNGTKSMKILGPKIWKMLPHELQQPEHLKELRKAINGN